MSEVKYPKKIIVHSEWGSAWTGHEGPGRSSKSAQFTTDEANVYYTFSIKGGIVDGQRVGEVYQSRATYKPFDHPAKEIEVEVILDGLVIRPEFVW